MNALKGIVQKILAQTEIKVNGDRAWDIQVHNDRFFRRVLVKGSVGLGESYMDGWWDCLSLDEFFYRIFKAKLHESKHYYGLANPATFFRALTSRVRNLQTPSRSLRAGQRHYDLGNDLFDVMLDERRIYSCGYWKDARDLDEAQEAKLDLVCRKIGLGPGMHILDIGCGWGSFVKYAAEKYQARCTGITISRSQFEGARSLCSGLPVQILLQDYREITGLFDHVVSIGMFEHVGYKNYRPFMRKAHELLKDGGVFLLQTIGQNRSYITPDPWIARYIFPNSKIPSIRDISDSSEGFFVVEDLHNFGTDYDKTLVSWHRNLESGWAKLQSRFGERFRRMWRYYLLMCAAAFRARELQLWQWVFSKNGVAGGYRSVR